MSIENQPAQLSLDGLRVTYGEGALAAVESLSLQIAPGEFVCLVGPTGCGKSSILNAVGGFVRPTSGAVRMNGIPVHGPGADRGIVFQNFVLFPWLSVRGNVEFGLTIHGLTRADCRARSEQILKSVGLGTRANAYPYELSGGMQQRVAIARALVNDPSVLLMDEPFGSLDAQTRRLMQELVLRLCQHRRTTVLFVTHDIDEAILLADRVVVLSSRPATIKAEIAVQLPRPRKADVSLTTDFLELKREVYGLIQREVDERHQAE